MEMGPFAIWNQGAVDTGLVDKNGAKIEQYDLLQWGNSEFMVMYSVYQKAWIATADDDVYIENDYFNQATIKEKGWGLKPEEA